MHPSLRLGSLALLLLTGCASAAPSGFAVQGAPELPSPLLVAAGDAPALFLGPEADAARIAFLSDRVAVQIAGARQGERVPVRIDGPLRTRGYVHTAALHLRVQRRGRVRGTPIYVGPNDLLQVLGPAAEPDRISVRASAVVGGRALGPFDGSFPSIGLAVHAAAAEAEAVPPGQRYALPAGSRVELREQPNDLPALVLDGAGPLELDVLNQQQGWAAVRAGQGPYLIGWTQLPPGAAPLGPSAEAEAQVPASARVTLEPPAPAAPSGAPASASAPAQGGVRADLASPSATPHEASPDPASTNATPQREASPDPASPNATPQREASLAPASPSATPQHEASVEPASPPSEHAVEGIPTRIAAEPGELRRVAAGTKVAFGEQVIAVFKVPGWARVLKSYDGYADVFAAVDDDVSVRGLVRTIDLGPVELTETQPTAAAR